MRASARFGIRFREVNSENSRSIKEDITMSEEVANAIQECFGDDSPLIRGFEYIASHSLGSSDCSDSSLVDALYQGLAPEEGRSLVGAVEQLAESAKRIGNAITPNICGNNDATGGHVESLTEAVMGMTSGMIRIADAIESLAEAVRKA